MKLHQAQAEIYVPDGAELSTALARTTHMAIAAHQDDIEIMAVDGVLQCFHQPERWFTGVVLTDGRGSPRTGLYAGFSDEDMMAVRIREQKAAADLGDYGAQVFCAYSSAAVKQSAHAAVLDDIQSLVVAAAPEVVYTHNLADKHPTHVAVAARVIEALRRLPTDQQPRKLYGCEVWRGLDWLPDDEKVVFDCSARPALQEALLGVFDSQTTGGKRYDLATMGRRAANATYYQSHATDEAAGLAFAMDLTPLVTDPDLDIRDFVRGFIDRFSNEVTQMLDTALRSSPN